MTEQTAPFRDLKLDEIKRLIDEGYNVVDVREDWEWKRGHVPGAKHVVLSSILANPAGQKFEDKTIFVCGVGERSAVASEMADGPGLSHGRRRDVRRPRSPVDAAGHRRCRSRHRLRARLDPRAYVRRSALGTGDGLARPTAVASIEHRDTSRLLSRVDWHQFL